MAAMNQELLTYLSQFVTPRRLQKMHAVLAERSRYLTVLLEDIYQPHNASAVLRSCDSCGVQDVSIVEKRNRYRVNPGVELGTAQWLTLRRYRLEGGSRDAPDAGEHPSQEAAAPQTARLPASLVGGALSTSKEPVTDAIRELRERGYRIVATTPHGDDVELGSFDLSRGKAALCFGTEMEGLSRQLLAEADEHLRIPMYGFVESFNISVSAAIVIYTLTQRLRRESNFDWRLTDEEREETLLAWLRGSVKEAPRLEKRFRAERRESHSPAGPENETKR